MLGIFFIFAITHLGIKIIPTKFPKYVDASVIINMVHKGISQPNAISIHRRIFCALGCIIGNRSIV